MPRGGTLKLCIDRLEPEPAVLQAHPGVQPGRFIRLSVSDTGCGIPEALFDRIFEPFFTTKGVGAGTGLGLASVKSIAEDGGGFACVKSKLDHGSTFEFYLPMTDAPAAKSTAVVSNTLQGNETILVVEDEHPVRGMMRRFLEQNGYTVLEAPDAREALRIAAERIAAIDLLITDVVMPGISGRELVEQITAIRPDLKYLYVSGYSTDEVLHHGVLQAQLAFLQKPFAPDVLAAKVREILDLGHGSRRPNESQSQ